MPAKNFDKVFEAIAKIDRKFIVTIVGEGEYRDNLEKAAMEYRVKAEFLGSVANDELAQCYSDHDIVIMPEAWGSGMPKVVLEAMASGAVIIASNIRSVRQLLRDGENGFICEPDIRSIQSNLELVLSMPNKDIDRITQTARNEVENVYSCLLYTSPSPRDKRQSRMPSSA